MNAIKDWFMAHSVSAKTVSSAWLFLLGMYYASPPFHDYILDAYNALPRGVHAFLAGVLIPALIFWRTTHSTSVTATIEDGAAGTASVKASATIVPEGK